MKFISVLIILVNLSLSKDLLYFLPYENKQALDSLVKSISNAKKSIDVSIYTFTYKPISNAIKNSAKRGVRVKIIGDYGQIKNKNAIGYLAKYKNIDVCLLAKNNKNNYGIMHQKMAIIDKQELIIGSANWSRNAFENSYEVLFFTKDREQVEKANHYYKKMLKKCQKY